MARLEETYRQLYSENRRLMEYLRELDVPLPQGFSLAVGFLVNRSLSRVVTRLVQNGGDGEELEEILAEARQWKVSLETKGIESMICLALQERLSSLLDDPLSAVVPNALRFLDLAERFGLTLNLWRAQTLFAQICQRHLRFLLSRRAHEEPVAHQVTLLRRLGERLGFSAVEGIPLNKWEQ